jgi:hypothetical protein
MNPSRSAVRVMAMRCLLVLILLLLEFLFGESKRRTKCGVKLDSTSQRKLEGCGRLKQMGAVGFDF